VVRSRTRTTPSTTTVSVPSQVSWVSHLVPRTKPDEESPRVRKLPLSGFSGLPAS
jgi:hypothetical protein